MTKLPNCMVVLVCVCFLPSCASFMQGAERSLNILSKPDGAYVYVDGRKMGVTPLAVSLKRSSQHTVRIDKIGYQPYTVTFKRKTSPWFYGNLISWGLFGLATDASKGAMYNLVPVMDTTIGKGGSVKNTATANTGNIAVMYGKINPVNNPDIYKQDRYTVMSFGFAYLLNKRVAGTLNTSFPYKVQDVTTGATTQNQFNGSRAGVFASNVLMTDLLNIQAVKRKHFIETGFGINTYAGGSASVYPKLGYGLVVPVNFLSTSKSSPVLFKPAMDMIYLTSPLQSFGTINNNNKIVYLLGQTSGNQFTVPSSRYDPGGTFNTNTLEVDFRRNDLLLEPRLSLSNQFTQRFYWSIDVGWVLPLANRTRLYLLQQSSDKDGDAHTLALVKFNTNGDAANFNNQPFSKSPSIGAVCFGVNIGMHIWSKKVGSRFRNANSH